MEIMINKTNEPNRIISYGTEESRNFDGKVFS